MDGGGGGKVVLPNGQKLHWGGGGGGGQKLSSLMDKRSLVDNHLLYSTSKQEVTSAENMYFSNHTKGTTGQ